MNKEGFIKKLSELTKLDEESCIKINEILENHLIIGKKGKEAIINELKVKLFLDEKTANSIYNKCMGILGKEIKEKLAHPFKSLD